MSKWSKKFWYDLGERVASSLIGALLTCLTLTGTDKVDWSDATIVWSVLGVPPLTSLLKGLLANLKDYESGPSMLPSPPAPVVDPDGPAE